MRRGKGSEVDLVALAQKIRSVRKGRRMTMDALAKKASVSKSLISRIESFRVTPSLPVLLRIAEALGVLPGDLLENVSDGAPEAIVVRRNERKSVVRNPERRGLRYHQLAGTEHSKIMSAFLIDLAPGMKEYRPMPHEGEEFSQVLKGRARYTVRDEEHILRTGDSIYVEARVPHSICCVGKVPAQLLNIIAGMGKSYSRK